MKFSEQNKRSILKAITFRILIVVADIVVVFWITGSYALTLGVVVVSNVTSTLLYYLHERAWNQVHWGIRHQKS